MIIDDLNIGRSGWYPPETLPELVVHANAMLSTAPTLECFEPVPRRYPQILEPTRNLQLSDLASRNRLNARESLDVTPVRERRRFGVTERNNHGS